MSGEIEAALLWRTRFVWFLLGAGASAVLLWNRGGPVEAPVTANAGTELGAAAPASGRTDLGSPTPSHATPSTTGGASTSTGSDDTGGSGYESSTGPGDLDASSSTDGVQISGTDGDALPSIPLPRMPGTRFMRRMRQPDDEGDGWLVTLGLSVPAPGPAVENFYRSALKDQSMKVFGGKGAAPSDGRGFRSTLRARGKYASADVTINQRAGKLRSVVRIYWRTSSPEP